MSGIRIRAIQDKIGVRHHSLVVGGIGGKTGTHQNHLLNGFPLSEKAISTQATECKQCTVLHAHLSATAQTRSFDSRVNFWCVHLKVAQKSSARHVDRDPHIYTSTTTSTTYSKFTRSQWPNLRTAPSTVGRPVCPIGCKLSTYSRQSEQGLVQMIATAVVRRDVFRECVQMCQPDFLQALFLHCRVLSHRCWLISSSTPSSIA